MRRLPFAKGSWLRSRLRVSPDDAEIPVQRGETLRQSARVGSPTATSLLRKGGLRRLAVIGGTHPLARKSVPYGAKLWICGRRPSSGASRHLPPRGKAVEGRAKFCGVGTALCRPQRACDPVCLSANVACGDRTAASRPYGLDGGLPVVAPHPPFGRLMLRLPFPAA